MSQIGFIGLGIMGKPMSRNLLKAGHTLVVYDVVPALAGRRVGGRARRVAHPAASCRRARKWSSPCCPTGRKWRRRCSAPAACWKARAPGSIVVDMSSISPLVSQKVAAACAAKGVEFLDAPVSGGEPKAIDGTLAIMVGGKPEVFDTVQPVLQKMGSSVTLTGRGGRGQRHQAGEPDHGGLQHRGHGRSAGAGHHARGSIRRWCSTPSRAGWPAAPC